MSSELDLKAQKKQPAEGPAKKTKDNCPLLSGQFVSVTELGKKREGQAMRSPGRLCFGLSRNISIYSKDCLESIGMAWLLVLEQMNSNSHMQKNEVQPLHHAT